MKKHWMEDEHSERGRQIIEAGQVLQIDRQKDYDAVVRYFTIQRDIADQTGSCERKCEGVELMELSSGDIVCPHTFEPCKKQQLHNILSTYGKLFNE